MKKFITDIKNSIYGRDYQTHFGSRTFGQALGFISKITFIEVLIFVIAILIALLPVVKVVLDREKVSTFLDTYVPSGAEVEIKDGVVSTPDGKPVIVSAPEEVKEFENILVVDPSITSDELEKFEEYKTTALITSDKIISLEEGAVKVSSLSEIPDYKINRETLVGLYEQFRPFIYVMIPVIGIIFMAILFVFGLVITLIFTLALALITSAVSKVKGVGLSYKQSYIVTLFALTPLTIITAILFLFGESLGLLLTIVLLALFVVLNLKKK